jgi:hypothetical protein
MALRRWGEEATQQQLASAAGQQAGTSQLLASEAMDFSRSNLSVSQHSQVQSFHSAVHRADRLGDADPTPAKSAYSSSWNAGASDVVETSRQSQELLNEMRRLRLQMSELERVAGSQQSAKLNGTTQHFSTAEEVVADEPKSSGGQPYAKDNIQGSGSSIARSGSVFDHLTASGSSSSATGWEYRPHASGDPIDAAVATLVNRPGRYRGWRALLCRLDQGVYLCGTRKVHLRADLTQEKIEASDDGGVTWSDLEVLMKGAEAAQRALLERARDASGMAS